MTVRRATPADREVMLLSFRPLFGDWDYLPQVIDEWLSAANRTVTLLVWAGPDGSRLVAMLQADELAPGDWYMRGLRSNPASRPDEVGCAIVALRRAALREVEGRRADSVR